MRARSLLPLETYQRIRRGISVVPQERELFPEMTVMENLRSGAAYIPEAKGKGRSRAWILSSGSSPRSRSG